MSSDEKEFGSKGITRRDFLYSTAAAGASVPILKSNKAIQQPPTERKVIPPAEFKSDRDYIEEKIRTGIVPSLVIMVVKDRQTIWAEAFGYADLEKKREANLNSIYKIASISKPITVTGLMTLVDRGLVNLDKPANDYLTDAKLRAYLLVEALTRAGHVDPDKLTEARLLFERMLGHANRLGLYAEETGRSGQALGNFPQAFTHLALISAAFNLDRSLGRV